jgi:hypothetical protein
MSLRRAGLGASTGIGTRTHRRTQMHPFRPCVAAGILACFAPPSGATAASATFQVQVIVQQPARIEMKGVANPVGAPTGVQPFTVAGVTTIAIQASGALLRLVIPAVHENGRQIEVRGIGLPVTFGRRGGQLSMVLGEERSELEIGYSAVSGEDRAGVSSIPLHATVEIIY